MNMIKTKIFCRIRSLTLILLLTSLIALLSVSGYTSSRYNTTDQKTTIAEAEKFQFESDFLRSEKENACYDVYTVPFSIKLCNFKNGITSSVNIYYTITVTGGSVVNSSASGTLSKDTQNTNEHLITPDAGCETVIVSVQASPYSEKLTATFNIVNTETKSMYTYTDYGNYGLLEIKTGSLPPKKIEWNNKLVPDSTNELMGVTPVSPYTIVFECNSQYEIVFFETTPVDYSVQEREISGESIALTP